MRLQRDPRRYSEAAREDEERWPDDVGRAEEEPPIEENDLELVDEEWDDEWPETKGLEKIERHRRHEAEADDHFEDEWLRSGQGKKRLRDCRVRRSA